MQIQINTDNHIDGHEALQSRVEGMIEQHLGHHFKTLTRIEAYLSDANAERPGDQDKQCSLEARPTGADPVAASHKDESMEAAIRGACQKLRKQLDELAERRRGY
jgi:ribosomal subunit interface protein